MSEHLNLDLHQENLERCYEISHDFIETLILKNCAKFYLKVGLYCQTTLVVLNEATRDTFIPLHFFKN